MSKWTEEMTATATRLWKQGGSASDIAGTLRTVSRNAVIGKMNRLNIPRGNPAKMQPINKKKRHRFQWSDASIETLKRMWRADCSVMEIARELGASERGVYAKRRQLGLGSRKLKWRNRKSKRSLTFNRWPRPANAKRVLPPAPARKDEPESLCLSLLELTDTTCRWPHGEVGKAGFGFCGHPIRQGTSYCDFHAKVANPSLREEAA